MKQAGMISFGRLTLIFKPTDQPLDSLIDHLSRGFLPHVISGNSAHILNDLMNLINYLIN